MTDDRKPKRAPSEDDLRAKLQIIAGAVVLVCIVFLVIIDPIGRLLIDPDFHTSDLALGTLVGALLVILGLSANHLIPSLFGRKHE